MGREAHRTHSVVGQLRQRVLAGALTQRAVQRQALQQVSRHRFGVEREVEAQAGRVRAARCTHAKPPQVNQSPQGHAVTHRLRNATRQAYRGVVRRGRAMLQ